MLGRPGTGSFLVTRYLSSAPSVCLLPVRYRERKLWGIISLSQHVLLIIITFALHIAWHPEPNELCFLHHSCTIAHYHIVYNQCKYLGNYWKLQKDLFYLLNHQKPPRAKKSTIK